MAMEDDPQVPKSGPMSGRVFRNPGHRPAAADRHLDSQPSTVNSVVVNPPGQLFLPAHSAFNKWGVDVRVRFILSRPSKGSSRFCAPVERVEQKTPTRGKVADSKKLVQLPPPGSTIVSHYIKVEGTYHKIEPNFFRPNITKDQREGSNFSKLVGKGSEGLLGFDVDKKADNNENQERLRKLSPGAICISELLTPTDLARMPIATSGQSPSDSTAGRILPEKNNKEKSLERNIDNVVFGDVLFKSWYPSWYPKEIIGEKGLVGDGKGIVVQTLYVCKWCFGYGKNVEEWARHCRACEKATAGPPGRKIYTHGPTGSWSVWEVDGEVDTVSFLLFCHPFPNLLFASTLLSFC
jgi:hypothetical protein